MLPLNYTHPDFENQVHYKFYQWKMAIRHLANIQILHNLHPQDRWLLFLNQKLHHISHQRHCIDNKSWRDLCSRMKCTDVTKFKFLRLLFIWSQTYLVPGHLVPHNWSPWTNSPQTGPFGLHGHMVLKINGLPGQMVPFISKISIYKVIIQILWSA